MLDNPTYIAPSVTLPLGIRLSQGRCDDVIDVHQLTEIERAYFEQLPPQNRAGFAHTRISARSLARTLAGSVALPVEIKKCDRERPVLTNQMTISLSHGRDYWAVVVDKNGTYALGVDIEQSDRPQFTNPKALKLFDAPDDAYQAARDMWDKPLTSAQVWVMKEAGLKALSAFEADLTVGRMGVTIQPGNTARVFVKFRPEMSAHTLVLESPENHVAALSYKRVT